jgi:hypothetical protein
MKHLFLLSIVLGIIFIGCKSEQTTKDKVNKLAQDVVDKEIAKTPVKKK